MEGKELRGRVKADSTWYYDARDEQFAQRDRSFPLYLVTILSERALDFTLRSRYKTISISFAKGPLGTEDFLDIFPGFGILYGPLYLAPSPPSLFLSFLYPFRASPDAYRSDRVADWRCLLLDNTFAYERTSPFPPSPPHLKERQYPRSYYYCPQFHPPLCFRYYSMECLVGRTLSDFRSWLTQSRGGEFFFCTEF